MLIIIYSILNYIKHIIVAIVKRISGVVVIIGLLINQIFAVYKKIL